MEEIKEIKNEIYSLEEKLEKIDKEFALVIVDLKNQIINVNVFLKQISESLKDLSLSSISQKDIKNIIHEHKDDCARVLGDKVNTIIDARLGKYTFYIIGAMILQIIIFYFLKK